MKSLIIHGANKLKKLPEPSVSFWPYETAETFEKCSISFKFKEGENFNHRNTLSILRIKI